MNFSFELLLFSNENKYKRKNDKVPSFIRMYWNSTVISLAFTNVKQNLKTKISHETHLIKCEFCI